jgi:outer membrane protein TolC
LQIDVNKTKLHTQQSVWAKNMGLQSDIRYGTFDNFSTNTSEGQSPSVLATRNSQTNYGIGAYIKFPLYDLIDRKNLIHMAKAEVEQAVSMAEAQRNELRQTVIKQYNDLILKQRLLKIRSKYFITSKINMEMVEKEFHNGVISVSEYARISEIFATAEANYEAARVDFNTAFQIMEEIVGYKFNLTETKKNTNEHH